MPQPVLAAVTEHLQLEATIGGYEAAEAQHAALQVGLYTSVGRLVNAASAREIAVVGSATAAWDLAFYSLPLAAGDRILTGRAEYGANYVAFLQVRPRPKQPSAQPIPRIFIAYCLCPRPRPQPSPLQALHDNLYLSSGGKTHGCHCGCHSL